MNQYRFSRALEDTIRLLISSNSVVTADLFSHPKYRMEIVLALREIASEYDYTYIASVEGLGIGFAVDLSNSVGRRVFLVRRKGGLKVFNDPIVPIIPPLSGKRVLVVDDAILTGGTMQYVIERLAEERARPVAAVVVEDKDREGYVQERPRFSIPVRHVFRESDYKTRDKIRKGARIPSLYEFI